MASIREQYPDTVERYVRRAHGNRISYVDVTVGREVRSFDTLQRPWPPNGEYGALEDSGIDPRERVSIDRVELECLPKPATLLTVDSLPGTTIKLIPLCNYLASPYSRKHLIWAVAGANDEVGRAVLVDSLSAPHVELALLTANGGLGMNGVAE